MAHKNMEGGMSLGATIAWWAIGWVVILCLLSACGGGGEDEAPRVAEEAPKFHVPTVPDPCTVTYPCQKK